MAGKLLELDRPPAPLMLAVAAAAAVAGSSAPMHRSRTRARLALAGATAGAYLLTFVTLSSPVLGFSLHREQVLLLLPRSGLDAESRVVGDPPAPDGGLWTSRHRPDPHLAMVLGVAAAPWWVFWLGDMAGQVYASERVAASTVLPTLAVLLALVATMIIAARAVAGGRAEMLRRSR